MLLKWNMSRIRNGSFVLFSAGSSVLISFTSNILVFMYVAKSGLALKRTACFPSMMSDFFSTN